MTRENIISKNWSSYFQENSFLYKPTLLENTKMKKTDSRRYGKREKRASVLQNDKKWMFDFKTVFLKINEIAYIAQFWTLFPMVYLNVSFYFITVEKNRIYWRSSLVMHTYWNSDLSQGLFSMKSTPSCSVFFSLSNVICWKIIHLRIEMWWGKE